MGDSRFMAKALAIGIMLGNVSPLRLADERSLGRALWYGYEGWA